MSAAPRGRLRGRPGLAATVLACAAGAALVLLAAGRTWAVRVADRPAPLPDARTALTGGDLVAWLPSLAWAALAAAAALPAVRGHARRGLGGLLAVAGAAMAVAAGVAGVRAGSPAGWPALATVGAAAVAAAGGLALTASGDWPALGARYERRGAAPPDRGATAPDGLNRTARDGHGGSAPDGGTFAGRERQLWEALDRGEDPTA
ncbi:MAG: Trp biosynthesis-associated membrane protein [Micromonosporaceae bacterium]